MPPDGPAKRPLTEEEFRSRGISVGLLVLVISGICAVVVCTAIVLVNWYEMRQDFIDQSHAMSLKVEEMRAEIEKNRQARELKIAQIEAEAIDQRARLTALERESGAISGKVDIERAAFDTLKSSVDAFVISMKAMERSVIEQGMRIEGLTKALEEVRARLGK